MKRTILMIILATTLLSGCKNEVKQNTANLAIEHAKESDSKQAAKDVLADIKSRMTKEVKPEYFTSDEWKMFVDAYWNGYNKGQEQMKLPNYMKADKIEY